jgi:hypothetical protein
MEKKKHRTTGSTGTATAYKKPIGHILANRQHAGSFLSTPEGQLIGFGGRICYVRWFMINESHLEKSLLP